MMNQLALYIKKLNPDLNMWVRIKSMPGYVGFFYIHLFLLITLTKMAFHKLQVFYSRVPNKHT